jgi:hypothetical protein
MKIAAVYCVYNEEEYFEYSVRSILKEVDQVILCLGTGPYTAYARESNGLFPPDGTELLAHKLVREFPGKVELIKKQWASQLEHRDEGLKRCVELGIDYYFLVDGDEVYRKDHLFHIRKTIEDNPRIGTYIIKCHTFWRSFKYRIPPEILTWRPRRIFKITRHRKILGIPFPHRLRFKGINDMTSLGPIHEFPPEEAAFYHFSYARSPKRMREKLSTFPHAQEILGGWYEKVWRTWPQNRQRRDIHPTDPPKFPKAVEQSLEDLPEIMQAHPYYPLDVIE